MREREEPRDDLDEILDRTFAESMSLDRSAEEVTKGVVPSGWAESAAEATPSPSAVTGPIPVSAPPPGTSQSFSIVNRRSRQAGDPSSIVEALTVGILISDTDGIVRTSNRAARRMLGVSEGTMAGVRVAELFATADRNALAPLLESALQGRGAKEIDLIVNGRQGPLPARVAAAGRFDADHRLKEVVWTIRESGPADPSVEVRFLQARTDLLAELGLELAREIGPIGLRLSEALLGARQILDQSGAHGTVTDQLRARIADASSGLLRLDQAVAELERFAYVPQLKVEPVDPSLLLARAETLLARSLRANRIRVRNDIDDPPPRILADAARLTEIFVNLIRNARNSIQRRYGEEGADLTGAGRRLIVVESFVKPPWVILSFTNNGAPIPPSEVERVFLPSVGRGEARRPWIGLPETAALVKMMGGAVRCQALEDEGTRFVLTFRKAD
ncbi:MAG TPA: PAS domain-containing protein [Thermoanaerobaculia bacterium]